MQAKEPLVSVIIPVYNSKKRLASCLDHVDALDYPALEVIVVDDCSTDGSLEICREYEKKYPFFHVITKENEGVSAARNRGLEEAHGKYIQFIDSDDFVKKDATSAMVKRMEKDGSDLVIAGYYDEKAAKDHLPKDGIYEGRASFLKDFPELFSSYFLHVPWNKLYRHDRIQGGFPRDLDKGEDLLFNLNVFRQAEKISTMNQSVYDYYNIETESLSFRFRENAMEIEERLYLEVKQFYVECGGEDLTFLNHFYLRSIKNKFYDLMRHSGKNYKACREKIQSWLSRDSIQGLYSKKDGFSQKDKVLLFCMKHKCCRFLYWYYR